ncbi:Cup2/Haa1 [Kluyveromyces lactis]|nr:Cup2/Haa1 [Kluyveromyces lactis]
MVLINGVKYACERCIRGHRVTTCNHTDQPLTMIKPKGRPSTTCAHCKELRKNRNANPSGQCTCGRQEKKRIAQKAREESGCVCKNDPDHCPCHKKRAPRRKKQSHQGNSAIGLDINGKISKHTNGGYSYQSLHSLDSSHSVDQDLSNFLASPISMNTSFSTGWDNASLSSSNRSPPGNGPDSKNTIGLEPLSTMKPITPKTRTKVGEVFIPLTEYVPTNIASSEDQADHINPLLMGEHVSIYNDVTADAPNVTYFADTSKSLSYNQLKEQRKALSEQHLRNNADNISKSGSTQRIPLSVAGRSSSFVSNISSHDSVASSNNDFISSLNSSDSLSSMLNSGNAHHYQDMLHHSNNGRGYLNPVQVDQSQNVYGFDTDSVRSVEVLSITPSFMDIPESKPPSIGSNSSANPFISWKSVNSRRERSVSIHKNHRYDNENKRKRHPKNVPNGSTPQIKSMVSPAETSSTALPASGNHFSSPADSTNTVLSANTQYGDPSVFSNEKIGVAPSFVEPSFTTDFNQALKQSNMVNQNIIDNNSLFSGTSEGNNPSPNDLFPVEFADIDDLMTHL